MTADVSSRFFNEAKAVNRVNHQGLVQISDFGVGPDGRAYLVMEFLDGETLGARLKRQGALPLRDAVYLARQIAASLAAAHDKDIIHRDLKPDNVMIIPDSSMPGGERTKLLDFGLAKISRPKNEAHLKTNSAALFGTPAYMSPEQCKGAGQVDAKTDVYSLGVMLFEMLTGRHLFLCKTPGEMISHHLIEAPPPLQSVAPHIPKPVATFVSRLLCKEREDRPTMAEVVVVFDALNLRPPPPPSHRVQDHQDIASSRAPTEADEIGRWSSLSRLIGQRMKHRWSRSSFLLGGLVLAFFLSAGVISMRLWQRQNSPRPVSVPVASPSRPRALPDSERSVETRPSEVVPQPEPPAQPIAPPPATIPKAPMVPTKSGIVSKSPARPLARKPGLAAPLSAPIKSPVPPMPPAPSEPKPPPPEPVPPPVEKPKPPYVRPIEE